MPVSKLSKNGDPFAVALSGRKIITLDNPEPILQALRYVMVLVGVRANNLPNDHEKTILVNYIAKHYGGHTAEEIKLAFEKAINGELDIDDATCFENFSVLYFSKIMNAYRSWAVGQVVQLEEPPTQVILDEKQLDDIVRQDIENYFQRCRNGWIPENGIPEYFRDILVKDGLLKKGESIMEFLVQRLTTSENIYIRQ